MSSIEALVAIATKLPDDEINQLVDQAKLLYQQTNPDEEMDGMLWSYDVLAEDWLSPADEEAWKDL